MVEYSFHFYFDAKQFQFHHISYIVRRKRCNLYRSFPHDWARSRTARVFRFNLYSQPSLASF